MQFHVVKGQFPTLKSAPCNRTYCADLGPRFETEKFLSPLAFVKTPNLVAHVDYPSTMFPK